MYEEEDDDLPMQYRRLTAHLQTGSVDFNRRLAAYLTNQVAMRSAIDKMVTNSYAQQYPNAPQFAHSQQNPYPSPMMQQGMMHQSPTNYRSSPYPSPHSQGFRPQPLGRSASIATPHELPGHNQGMSLNSPTENPNHFDHRRMSMPLSTSASPVANRSNQPLPTPSSGSTSSEHDLSQNQPPQHPQSMSSTPMNPPGYNPALWSDGSPFTTSLPTESQMLLAPALDPNNPFSSMLMAGSESFTQSPYYPWGDHQSTSKPPPASNSVHPSYDGMSATLAPSALDKSVDLFSTLHSIDLEPESNTTVHQLPTLGHEFSFDGGFGGAGGSMKGLGVGGLTRENSAQGLSSGQVTPGEGIWDSFIEGGSWGDENIAS